MKRSDHHLTQLSRELIPLFAFWRRLIPPINNQAIADDRGLMLERLKDLDVEFSELNAKKKPRPGT